MPQDPVEEALADYREPEHSDWLRASDITGPLGTGAAYLDKLSGGMLSTPAGLINAAIPGQPLGDWRTTHEASQKALREAPYGKPIGEIAEYPGMPGSAAIFVGLPGIHRLEQARLRHRDDWGGSRRLEEAQERAARGAQEMKEPLPLFKHARMRVPQSRIPHDAIWRDTGWAAPNAWGKPERGSQWSAWVPGEDLRLRESQRGRGHVTEERPAGSGNIREIPVDMFRGWWDEVLHHTDDVRNLLTAEPAFQQLPVALAVYPQLDTAHKGATAFNRPNPFTGRSRKGQLNASHIEGMGHATDELVKLLQHEDQHVVGGRHLNPIIAPGGSMGARARPIHGSEAEKQLQQMLVELETSAPDEATAARLRRYMSFVPGFVSYLHDPPEKQARETVIRALRPLYEQRNAVPGITLDTYTSASGPWDPAHHFGLPMTAYRAPKDKGRP